jgi:hypothetical protein
MLFSKFDNAINDPGGVVVRPAATEKFDAECELGLVIGRRASHVGVEEALDHLFGYTVVNDLTMRDLQQEDRQWLRAKGSDGFAPVGPAVVTRDEIADPQRLRLTTTVNGEVWQESSTAEMIFPGGRSGARSSISSSASVEPSAGVSPWRTTLRSPGPRSTTRSSSVRRPRWSSVLPGVVKVTNFILAMAR